MYLPTKKLIVHHTADPENSDPADPTYPYPAYDADQAVQDVRSVYYYHAITLGWGDIGYNALIDRFGRVFEGRRGRDRGPDGGREIISPDVVAGHALNCNEGTAGVSLIGNYEVNQLGANEQTMLEHARRASSPGGAAASTSGPTPHPTSCRSTGSGGRASRTSPATATSTRPPAPASTSTRFSPTSGRASPQRAAALAIIKPSAQITSLPSQANIDAHSVTFAWKSPDNTAAEFSYYLEGWIPNLDTDEEYYIGGFTADKRPDWSVLQRRHVRDAQDPPGRPLHLPRPRPRQQERRRLRVQLDLRRPERRPAPAARIGVPGVIKN